MKNWFFFAIIILFHSQESICQRVDNSPYPFSSQFDSLIVIYDNEFSDDELFTIEILQGQLSKSKPKIYRDIGTGSSIWINDLEENLALAAEMSLGSNIILSKFPQLEASKSEICNKCPFNQGELPICGPLN